jgi:tagatose-1,6-bisphosphate aldolase
MTFIDADNRQLAEVTNPDYVPRMGENVRLADIPYVVDRVGYDIPRNSIERIWVVCRRA